MGSGELVGARSRAKADPEAVLAEAGVIAAGLAQADPRPAESYRALKQRYAAACRTYYSTAALTRRRILDSSLRDAALLKLYPLRTVLEQAIIRDFAATGLREDIVEAWASKSFFGVSAKQGVSIRYALASCVPTRTCGGRCYAHDGRDREIHQIFRGALNYFVGQSYEGMRHPRRSRLLDALSGVISYGVAAAVEDQSAALAEGFSREPRIRFSHVGEMAATPAFANDLAMEIRKLEPRMACVIYTRHPNASALDSSLFTVNFSLEGDDDPRRRWSPPGARIVASAWDGELSSIADVNFLEHHVEKILVPSGLGRICPVTAQHDAFNSCDAARCQLCFVPPVG